MGLILSSSKLQMAGALLLLVASALIFNPDPQILLTVLLTVGLCVGLDLLLMRIRGVKWFLPSAAMVSGLIIALIYQPTASVFELAVVCALAMGAKNFLRVGNRHLLNPAAFGLLLGYLFLGALPSWWGVSFYQFSTLGENSLRLFSVTNLQFLILLVPAIVSMYLMGRYRIALAFLATYTLFFSLSASPFTLSALFDPTLIFFSTVMLPEPMTSPHTSRNQLLFGATVALAVFVIGLLKLQLDPLILALLIGNLIFFRLR